MDGLPVRGPGVRALGLVLPPEPMPLMRRGRPLKRWRYVGVYAPEVMICAGQARIGPLPRSWWAVAEPGRPIVEHSSMRSTGVHFEGPRLVVDSDRVRIEIEFDEGTAVETASPAARGGYIWTRKQAGVPARGALEVEGRRHRLDALGVVDESAGYHDRHTAWTWSAGVGRAESGERLGWNLVSGIHDADGASERSLWVDGLPQELGLVDFAADLSRIGFAEGGALDFAEWSRREEKLNLLILRSRYRQPFGSFRGELPGGLRLAEGYGVMEEHDVRW